MQELRSESHFLPLGACTSCRNAQFKRISPTEPLGPAGQGCGTKGARGKEAQEDGRLGANGPGKPEVEEGKGTVRDSSGVLLVSTSRSGAGTI